MFCFFFRKSEYFFYKIRRVERFFKSSFSLFTAYQILRSERNKLLVFFKCNFKVQNCKIKLHFKMFVKKPAKNLTNFRIYVILSSNEWIRTWVGRFRFFATVFGVKPERPHVWPFTELDYVETVWRRVQESIGCGHERLGNAWKVNKKTFYYALGTKRSWVQVPSPQPK